MLEYYDEILKCVTAGCWLVRCYYVVNIKRSPSGQWTLAVAIWFETPAIPNPGQQRHDDGQLIEQESTTAANLTLHAPFFLCLLSSMVKLRLDIDEKQRKPSPSKMWQILIENTENQPMANR